MASEVCHCPPLNAPFIAQKLGRAGAPSFGSHSSSERERELDYFQSTKYADPIPSSPSIMRGGPNTDHLFEE